jgi:tRNA(Met) cytidine acetyltransferase
VLITPPRKVWTQYYATNSIIRFSYGDRHQKSLFAEYINHSLSADKKVAWHCPENSLLPVIKDTSPSITLQSSTAVVLSKKQNSILQAISQSWIEHTKSCHFISGARGRGKSTLLAKVCEQLLLDDQQKLFTQIAICAPSQTQRDIIKGYIPKIARHKSKLLSIAPDQTEDLTEDTLLIIDEAASIAPSLLTQLCERTKHSIICATTQGYEGSGKGLIYRWLPNASKTINTYKLSEPFRWRDNDALEAIMESIFEPKLPPLQLPAPESLKLHLLDKHTLLEQTALIKGCIALLQQAHYQSTPADILRMLDADDHQIWCFSDAKMPANSASLMGVICTITEGGAELFSDEVLCEHIAIGKRRVQGHMGLQAITSGIHEKEILTYKTCRIHRIAVRPEHQGQNIGSSMLACLHEQRTQLAIDGFSSSFGINKRLENFWRKNNYALIKVGHRKDTSSGSITGHYLHKSSQLYECFSDVMRAHVDIDIQYLRALGGELKLVLPSLYTDTDVDDASTQIQLAHTKLQLFSQNIISYAMAKPAIFYIAKQFKHSMLMTLFEKLHTKHLSKTDKQELLNELTIRVNNWLKEH